MEFGILLTSVQFMEHTLSFQTIREPERDDKRKALSNSIE